MLLQLLLDVSLPSYADEYAVCSLVFTMSYRQWSGWCSFAAKELDGKFSHSTSPNTAGSIHLGEFAVLSKFTIHIMELSKSVKQSDGFSSQGKISGAFDPVTPKRMDMRRHGYSSSVSASTVVVLENILMLLEFSRYSVE